MLKLRKRLLAAGLAAVLSVSAASMPVWSESEQTDDTAAAEVSETGTDEASGTDTAAAEDSGIYVTEDEAFADMQLMAENSKLGLYVNEKDCVFVIEDKNTGCRWWSYYYNSDTKKERRRKTMISVDYIDTVNKQPSSTPLRSHDSSVQKKCSKIENGVRFSFVFINSGKESFNIPLDIVLNEDGTFTATVPTSEIVEYIPETQENGDPGYRILSIHILENLASTYTDKDGMMVVSDGSGAVINYNNGTAAGDINTFESKVYGDDLAVGKLYAGAKIEQVTLPVMGNINSSEGSGLVMIATDGDAYSTEHAMVTGQVSNADLNACWFEFNVRSTDKYFMGSSNNPLTVYEANEIRTGNLSVTYTPIFGDDLDYNNVASVYRDYLKNKIGVTKRTESSSAPYYLTLYGGTVKTQSVMGFPVKIQTAATTYKQALEIVKMLENGGISNIKIIYEDFNEAGIVGQIAANFQYSSKLGGKNDYQEFKNYVESKGYDLFPSCDIMEYYQSGNGYSFTLNSSKQITKAYATQTPFELAFGLPHMTKDTWTILSPYYFSDIFNKLSTTFRQEGASGISLNQASRLLYSDFSRRNESKNREYFVREDTIEILQAGYQKLKDSGLKIMTENANQYMIPYADYIKDVPLYSSNYDIFDYDVPLTEMVLHGLVPYTTKAINKSADAQELRMLALVTGTPIHYELMYENPNKFADSEYDVLYYTNYKGWLDRSINEYKLFDDIIKSVSDAEITKFERISDQEYQSTFSNGDKIYINLETEEIKYNNKSFDVKDYGLGVDE